MLNIPDIGDEYFEHDTVTAENLPHKAIINRGKEEEIFHPTGGKPVDDEEDDFESDLDDDFEIVEPGKPRIHRTRHKITPDEAAAYAQLDPRWAPFSCEQSYNMAKLIVDCDMPHKQVDILLRGNCGVSDTVLQDFKSQHLLRRKLDLMPDGLGWSSWHQKQTTIDFGKGEIETVAFWMRNPLRVARYLISQPAYVRHLRFAPRFLSVDGMRVYRDMDTADWWYEQQVSTDPQRFVSNTDWYTL